MKRVVMGGKGKSVSAYRVIVQDGSGAPVKGAKVQVCSDLMCCAAKTDEAGIAAFADLDEMMRSTGFPARTVTYALCSQGHSPSSKHSRHTQAF